MAVASPEKPKEASYSTTYSPFCWTTVKLPSAAGDEMMLKVDGTAEGLSLDSTLMTTVPPLYVRARSSRASIATSISTLTCLPHRSPMGVSSLVNSDLPDEVYEEEK